MRRARAPLTHKRAAHAEAPRPRIRPLTVWLVICLSIVLSTLVYGMLRPRPPSAFDLPEAQLPARAPAPWQEINTH